MVHDIFVKVKMEVTRISTILNVFGSRRSNDVTRSIFCPNFCKMVTSMLQIDSMNLFVKARAWFNPITQGMAILIANTSTTFHRDERLENTHAMHGKCNYEIEMPEETSFLN
ncbi:hypothetical protein GmHk_05G013124 [Glycine max]|nr:hypothetical protein GmHk_05G013124 [Glycine max]